MVRIAYLISQYPTLSHTFILREITGLRRLGMDVGVASVLLPDREADKLTDVERSEYGNCYYIRRAIGHWPLLHLRTLFERPGGYYAGLRMAVQCSRGSLRQAARNIFYFGEAVAAGRWMLRGGYTQLHTHFASFTALLLHRVYGKPFSITLHGPDEFNDPGGQNLPEKLHHATLAIGISHYGAIQIKRYCDASDWPKVRTVRLGIDPAEFPFMASRERSESFRIISVGRLAKVKAHSVLIRAFALVRRRYPEALLTIIGAGPEMEPLVELARTLEAPVEFTGGLPNELVRGLVAKSDCFALASFAEGVPVVLMEAMALGVPCVATRVMGVPELIEQGLEGLLVEPGDEAALACAIEELIRNPELCACFRTAARAKVLRDYDLNRNIEKLSVELQAERGTR